MVSKVLTIRHGGAVLRIPVQFDAGEHVGEFNTAMARVVKAERTMQRDQTVESADAYGDAIMALYNLVFGAEQADSIDRFFGDDTFSLVSSINPFILHHIVPAVRHASRKAARRAKRDFLRSQRKSARGKT